MTVTTDPRGIDEMAARRPDAVRPRDDQQPPTLTPFAALLHRTASLITTENLPPAELRILPDSVQITATLEDGLAENTVRRWAAALTLIVDERPCDMPDGTAGTSWLASGFDGRGVLWIVGGARPEPAVAR